MTAPDHVVEPLKDFLRGWGHPYMIFGAVPSLTAYCVAAYWVEPEERGGT